MRTIALERARRIALGAQGLNRARPSGRIDRRHLRKVFDDISVLQIDSVNVVERAHNITLFSRLGPHPATLLDDMFMDRELFEYWGHEASFIPIHRHPALRFRMERIGVWRRVRQLMDERPGYIDQVADEVAARGPLTTSDLDDPGSSKGPWWGWSAGKVALEYLFAKGRVTSAERRNFTRYYDIPERVIPSDVLAEPALSREEAYEELLVAGARSHGIGTDKDLADYFRLSLTDARPILERLADQGRLERVQVDGWKDATYLHPEVSHPRKVEARALLGPFDPVVWFRPRAERLFDFHYRIEIYVPKEKRVHGYYVFPFLLGTDLCARVDLKADRHAGALLVRGAFLEEGRDAIVVARELAAELGEMARWLGLDDIVVERNGDLADQLKRAVG